MNDKDYIALMPLDEEGNADSDEVWIYGYKENEEDPNEEPELIYIEDEDSFGLKELTDLEKYLATTFDSKAEDKTYPAIYLTKDAKEHSASTVVLSGYFFSSNGDTKKSYDKLRSYVALWCEKKEKMTISGKSFQCGVTKSADALSAFKGAEKDYENVVVNLDGYDISFMFDDDDILEEVMIDRYDLTD